jgi:hypothetical protein
MIKQRAIGTAGISDDGICLRLAVHAGGGASLKYFDHFDVHVTRYVRFDRIPKQAEGKKYATYTACIRQTLLRTSLRWRARAKDAASLSAGGSALPPW